MFDANIHHGNVIDSSWRIVATAAALLFGLLCILPNIWQRFDTAYPFRGIEIMGGDQETFYATRVREIQDGHWWLGSVYLQDTKDLPPMIPPLGEWIIGGIGTALRLNIGHAYIAAKGIFAVLLFLAMTAFCARLTKKPWLSILAVSAVLFSWFLFASPNVFLQAIGGQPLGSDFLRFSRLANPLVSSTFFFLALWALLGFIIDRRRHHLFLCGLLTGLSFSLYPYAWSYLLVVLLLIFLWFCWQREWKLALSIAFTILFAGILALPYFWTVAAARQYPAYGETAMRLGLVFTHAPLFGGWLILWLLLASVFARRISVYPWFLRILAITGAIVLNQQVLTGVSLVPHHYHWYYIHPLAVMMSIFFAGSFVQDLTEQLHPRSRRMLFAFCLLVAAFWGVRFQEHSYNAVHMLWARRQQMYAPILSFLAYAIPPESAVYAVDDLRDFIPIYTSLNVYNAQNMNVSCLCSYERLRDVYFFDLWVSGVTAEDAAKTFPTSRRAEMSGWLYAMHYREAHGAYERIPDEDVRRIIEEYRSFLTLPDEEKLALYPLNVVVLPREQALTSAVKAIRRRSRLIHQDARYAVWDIRRL